MTDATTERETPTLRQRAGRIVRRLSRQLGYDIVKVAPPATDETAFVPPLDCDEFTAELMAAVRPYTLTSEERIMALVEAVRYVVRAGVPGAFVECGVWRGGSAIVMARTLLDLGVTDRDLYLYDTYTTMPAPGEHDVTFDGTHVADFYEESLQMEAFRYLPFEQVVSAIGGTGYPREHLHFVKGLVEETIPSDAPEQVALCRLDTDWYESTAHEMKHLWPRIPSGGILLVDDYGHFHGSKKAVDEFFAERGEHVLLNRIDFSGRLVVKP